MVTFWPGDMDIWVGLEEPNLDQLIAALKDFGVPGEISKEFFRIKGNAFRMGRPPMRIELITEATGIDFYDSYQRKVEIEADDIMIPFLGYDDLIRNKGSTGRLKDLADLESLGEPIKNRPKI